MDEERVQVHCTCRKCQRLFDIDVRYEARGVVLIKCPYCKEERRVCLEEEVKKK